jgi:hypothetical protein
MKVEKHAFDPGDRAHWFLPRCKICKEFKCHPIHDVEPEEV